MEGGALVAEALLASAESTEVLSGLGDVLIEEVECDALSLDYISQNDVSIKNGKANWCVQDRKAKAAMSVPIASNGRAGPVTLAAPGKQHIKHSEGAAELTSAGGVGVLDVEVSLDSHGCGRWMESTRVLERFGDVVDERTARDGLKGGKRTRKRVRERRSKRRGRDEGGAASYLSEEGHFCGGAACLFVWFGCRFVTGGGTGGVSRFSCSRQAC